MGTESSLSITIVCVGLLGSFLLESFNFARAVLLERFGEELSPLVLSPVGIVIISLFVFLPMDNFDCVCCFFLDFLLVFLRGLITWTSIPCLSDLSDCDSVVAEDSKDFAGCYCFLKSYQQKILSMY